jgi:hypothetical protein
VKIRETIKNNLTKLQGLSDGNKKIILWVVVAVLAVVMIFFWFGSVKERMQKMSGGLNQFNFTK